MSSDNLTHHLVIPILGTIYFPPANGSAELTPRWVPLDLTTKLLKELLPTLFTKVSAELSTDIQISFIYPRNIPNATETFQAELKSIDPRRIHLHGISSPTGIFSSIRVDKPGIVTIVDLLPFRFKPNRSLISRNLGELDPKRIDRSFEGMKKLMPMPKSEKLYWTTWKRFDSTGYRETGNLLDSLAYICHVSAPSRVPELFNYIEDDDVLEETLSRIYKGIFHYWVEDVILPWEFCKSNTHIRDGQALVRDLNVDDLSMWDLASVKSEWARNSRMMLQQLVASPQKKPVSSTAAATTTTVAAAGPSATATPTTNANQTTDETPRGKTQSRKHFSCNHCQVSVESLALWQEHLNSAKHMANLEADGYIEEWREQEE